MGNNRDLIEFLKGRSTGSQDPVTKEKERKEAIASSGKALVVVYFGKPYALVWAAGEHLRQLLVDTGAPSTGLEGFDLDACGVDYGAGSFKEGGLYIVELGIADDGPSDWGSPYRDCVPSATAIRRATKEEWQHHLDDEWPWDNEEGWT